VLASQIKVSNYDRFTGIDLLFSPNLDSLDSTDSLINLDGGAGERRGVAAMIILKPGIINFVGHRSLIEKYRNIMLDAATAKRSSWQPVIEEAMKPGQGEEIKSISIDGTKFFLAIKRSSPSRSTVLISDQNTVFKNINTLFFYVWSIHIIALVLSSLAIYRICSALSKPVDQAGEALSAISTGNFDTRLPTESSDLGRLFDCINQASDQLRAYLSASIKQAVIDAQLKEARIIQESFLIKDLPSLPQVGLIASSSPAYEIGADWYDAIAFGDSVYIVVADVCDKGIPSALYMSVFRSLLRNNIGIECKNSNSHDEVIVKALSALNNYMAVNHGDTAIFATVFVGAYAIGGQVLTYVVAGHEAPLLLCDRRLEALKMGGAAVGLFSDVAYTAHQCKMPTGSLLLAYSDGLPDSRNTEGFSFGTERIKAILEERSSYQWKAIELMQRLQQAEAEHRGEAEQFDDLTLFVVKVEDIDHDSIMEQS
jgi:serine phosphatase RsbU (regulator of sigma subunit)